MGGGGGGCVVVGAGRRVGPSTGNNICTDKGVNLFQPISGLELPYIVILLVDWRCYLLEIKRHRLTDQIFNATRQLSHTEAAPDQETE